MVFKKSEKTEKKEAPKTTIAKKETAPKAAKSSDKREIVEILPGRGRARVLENGVARKAVWSRKRRTHEEFIDGVPKADWLKGA